MYKDMEDEPHFGEHIPTCNRYPAILPWFNFTHALASLPQQHVSTLATKLIPTNAASAALAFQRTIITSSLNALILLNYR